MGGGCELEFGRTQHHLGNQLIGIFALQAVFYRRITVGFDKEVDKGRAAAGDGAANAHKGTGQFLH